MTVELALRILAVWCVVSVVCAGGWSAYRTWEKSLARDDDEGALGR